MPFILPNNTFSYIVFFVGLIARSSKLLLQVSMIALSRSRPYLVPGDKCHASQLVIVFMQRGFKHYAPDKSGHLFHDIISYLVLSFEL